MIKENRRSSWEVLVAVRAEAQGGDGHQARACHPYETTGTHRGGRWTREDSAAPRRSARSAEGLAAQATQTPRRSLAQGAARRDPNLAHLPPRHQAAKAKARVSPKERVTRARVGRKEQRYRRDQALFLHTGRQSLAGSPEIPRRGAWQDRSAGGHERGLRGGENGPEEEEAARPGGPGTEGKGDRGAGRETEKEGGPGEGLPPAGGMARQ